MSTTANEPKPPAIIARVIIPEQFIHWIGNHLFGRGYDLIEPALIAFIFQEAVNREFASKGNKISYEAMIDRGIERYEFALAQLCAEHGPRIDETRH